MSYTNKSVGFSLEIPASWKGKYSIDDWDTYVAFLHTESKLKSGAQGQLFAIIRYPGKMTNEEAQNGAGMRSLLFTQFLQPEHLCSLPIQIDALGTEE